MASLRTISCEGTPLEIGLQHGEMAAVEVKRSLKFYENLFREKNKLSWDEVCQVAAKFLPLLRKDWPEFCEELNGLSQGAGVPFLSILAMNVRTEIAYGMFSDGCTALSWKSSNTNFLAQNWDWQHEQAENLIHLRIRHAPKPTIDMVTEAGIIGKIGLNSVGVGTCLNAITAKGLDFTRLPCHLALRACLESESRDKAVEKLQKAGVASACHILVADPTGGVGLECTHLDIVELPMSKDGVVTHTNHLVGGHVQIDERCSMPDTFFRLDRINRLISKCKKDPGFAVIHSLLEDEKNYPASINRAQTEDSTVATLFNIVMDLGTKQAKVMLGRPCRDKPTSILSPVS